MSGVPSATTALSATPRASASAEAAASEGRTLFVDAKIFDCVGEAPQKCMRIREAADGEWELFYGQIEGFTHEEGYTYELRVGVDEIARPPADGSSLRYRLLEIVKKQRVP